MASSITILPGATLDDPALKPVAARVLNTVRLAGAKAVASAVEPKRYTLSRDPNSYERILRARYDSRPEMTRTNARTNTMALLKASRAQRERAFGPLARLDLGSASAIEQLAASVDGLPKLSLASPPAASPAAAAAAANQKLRLRLQRVVCVDETNGLFGSEVGRDEIVMGATTIDETGDTQTVKKFKVGSFNDGDVRRYDSPRQVTWFNAREGNSYPKSYFVTLVLAEEDMGGTAEFLDKLADKLEVEVRKELIKAGAEEGGAIGVAIAIVVGWVVGKVFDWFGELWGDEIFKPCTVKAKLPSPAATFGGKLESPAAVATFKGHGGEYHVVYDWQIER